MCTAFLYRNGEILAECGEDGEPVSRYVYGRGLSHVQTLRDGIYHAYHCDEQGSTAYMTGPGGGVENSYRYDAFGNLLEREETVPNRILYTGQQYDQETGQYYLRARYYNPVVGRFLQEDTYHGDGLNLYAYCANNPVVYYDPGGHDSAAVMKKAEEPDLPVGVNKGGKDVVKNNLVDKIKDIRAQMPNSNLAKRGNMAVADVDVPGIKDNFVAHSKINTELDKGANVADFSYLKPQNERIFTTYVDVQYPRYHDTEAKILEDIASQITDSNVSGTINLYSELPCCQSCSNIILEFRRMFPNIELNIFVE